MNILSRLTSFASTRVPRGRPFHTSSIAKEKYGLFIGGGSTGRTVTRLWKENLPDIAEYNDIFGISRHLHLTRQIPRNNIVVCFGKGAHLPEVSTNSLYSSMVHQFTSAETIGTKALQDASSTKVVGANLQDIQQEFESLSKRMTAEDDLTIVISTHGEAYSGALLWNEYFSTNVLKPSVLQDYLSQLNKKIEVTVFVDSCFSGQYLHLTSEKISLITSSSVTRESKYSKFIGSTHLQHLFGFSFLDIGRKENENPTYFSMIETKKYKEMTFFERQSACAQEANNYFASDSLTYFIDEAIEKRMSTWKIKKIYQKVRLRMSSSKAQLGLEFGFVAAILLDPFNILLSMKLTKAAMAVGKMAYPIIRTLSLVFFYTTTQRVKRTTLYKNWFTRDARLLLKRLQDIKNHMSEDEMKTHKQMIAKYESEIDCILKGLINLKYINSPDKPLTSYYYLYDKSKIFLDWIATEEEIQTFLTIHKNLQNNIISHTKL